MSDDGNSTTSASPHVYVGFIDPAWIRHARSVSSDIFGDLSYPLILATEHPFGSFM